jgi:hypothetical protein
MKYSFSFCLIFFTLWLFAGSCKDKNSTDLPGCVNTANPDTLTFAASQLKGWEVYSWPGCQDWNFSLLYGTNALKNYAEVTGTQASSGFVIKVWGKANMKTILSRMPAGESVSLLGENWLARTWGAGSAKDLHLPPISIINELQQAATQAHLNFQVVN